MKNVTETLASQIALTAAFARFAATELGCAPDEVKFEISYVEF